MNDVVIIGSGPAGVSTALWCRRLGMAPVVLDAAPEPGGQLLQIRNQIVDYPGLIMEDGTALRDRMIEHLTGAAIPLVTNTAVIRVTPERRVQLEHGELEAADVVVAAGARQRRLGAPGEAEMLARGEVYSTTGDAPAFAGKEVIIVGGGDRAVEGALQLAAAGASVTLVHRSDRFRARPDLLEQARRSRSIRFLLHAEVAAILGQARVEGALVRTKGALLDLPAAAVIVRIGIEPSSEPVRKTVTVTDDGLVRVDSYGATSVPGIWAAGDVCTPAAYSSISISVGQGAVVARRMLELRQNDPVQHH